MSAPEGTGTAATRSHRWPRWQPLPVLLVAGAAIAVLAAVVGLPVLHVLGLVAAGVAVVLLVRRSRARWWVSGATVVAVAALIAGPAYLAWHSLAGAVIWQGSGPDASYHSAGGLLMSRPDAFVLVAADGTRIHLGDPTVSLVRGDVGGDIVAIEPATGVLAATEDQVFWFQWCDGPGYQAPIVIDTPGVEVVSAVALTTEYLALADCPEDEAKPCTVTGFDTSGQQLWQLRDVHLPGRPGSQISTGLEQTYEWDPPPTTVVTGTGPFTVHDVATGHAVREVPGRDGVIAGDLVVTTAAHGAECRVTAVQGEEEVWETRVAADGCEQVYRSSELLLLPGEDELVALDLETGAEFRNSLGGGYQEVVGSIAVVREENEVVGVDLRTGSEVWREHAVRHEVGAHQAVLGERVHTWNPFVSRQARADGYLLTVLDVSTAETEFQVRLPDSVESTRLVDGALMVIEDDTLTVHGQAVDPRP